VSVTIGNLPIKKALLDIGGSINHGPLNMLKKLEVLDVKLNNMTLQLA